MSNVNIKELVYYIISSDFCDDMQLIELKNIRSESVSGMNVLNDAIADLCVKINEDNESEFIEQGCTN